MKKALLCIGITLITLATLVCAPYIYNHHIFSLAQLKKSINIGDSYEKTKIKFEIYTSEHEETGELKFSLNNDQLFIYHVSIFDDCQLNVSFEDNKVLKISYIGD